MDDNIRELKPAKEFDEQINILKCRGMVIDNEVQAKVFLRNNNYYRFTGYSLLFRDKPTKYIDGTRFETIVRIMEFDSRLRQILMRSLEPIEVFSRTQIAYWFCHNHDHDGAAHYDVRNYMDTESYSDFMNHVEETISKNSSVPFVKHHIRNYNRRMPLWCIVELLSFSTLSKFYGYLKLEDRTVIAKGMAIEEPILTNWLHCMSALRNTCAHYGRIYGTKISPPPKLGQKVKRDYPDIDINSLFAVIIAMLRFLRQKKDKELLINSITELIKEYKNDIELSKIGFPDAWEELMHDTDLTLCK